MQNEERPLSKYDVEFIETDNLFKFITDAVVTYEVAFKPTPYLFDEESAFSQHVVELVIRISKESVNQRPGLDRLVAPTIASVVADYYQHQNEAITLYVCDSADGKQVARKRKFDDWFRYFNQTKFVKHDFPVTDDRDGITYYNTVILKADNPSRGQIIRAFENVFGRYNDSK
ncbi:DUF6169 family protein [Fibrella aquatica]|jgi:Family of unknown function (DUF6169)|uniref:DUF6169 family protein n=1 Tax=Fibrella aquatica TaxID=3242487 RepID=UPI003520614B